MGQSCCLPPGMWLMNRDVVCGQGLFVIGGVGQGCGLWPGMVCDRGCWSGVWFVARDGL